MHALSEKGRCYLVAISDAVMGWAALPRL